MFHEFDECCEDFQEYSDIFDVIDAEDDAAYYEQLAIAEDARCDEDPYCNDWEAAAFQPEFE